MAVLGPGLVGDIEGRLLGLGVPGCSVGVVDDTGQERLAVFGLSVLAHERPITPETVFHPPMKTRKSGEPNSRH